MDHLWLNQQFKNHPGKSKSDLSQFLGIQASGISKMLSGSRQIKAKEYLLMRKFFEMPVADSHPVRPDKKLPLSFYLEEEGRQEWAAKEERLHYIVTDIPDSAMMPDFLPGERVLVDTREKRILKAAVFALREKDRILVRILEPDSSKIRISAISRDIAQRQVPLQKMEIIGRVVAKLNWL